MPEHQRPGTSRKADAALAAVGLVLGLGAACGYGAWRAISAESSTAAGRWSEFGASLVFPGMLIVAAIAAMVWLGWKANID